MDVMFTFKHHKFEYFRIEESNKLERNKLYLYRHLDRVVFEIEGFPDVHESMQFLYHHSDPHVISFPEPALDQIFEHRNPALWLFFKNRD